MNKEQKQQVRDALMRYVAGFDTQHAAAESLQGVSAALVSQVKNNNWELISERLWHHIARQVGFYCGEWNPADTGAYLLLRILFGDAQHYATSYGIAIGDGMGKTFTASHYIRENGNTHYIACNGDHNRKTFLAALMQETGIDHKGTLPDMLRRYTDAIKEQDEALLILDDAHLLKDRVLHMAIMIAAGLSGAAGIVLMGNDILRTRILDGVAQQKAGYDDIYNTIGRRFITLGKLGPNDVALVCKANGIQNEDLIAEIKYASGESLLTAAQIIQHQLGMKEAA